MIARFRTVNAILEQALLSRPVRKAELGRGDYFGEVALVDRTLRNATAVATSSASLVVFGQAEFTDLLAKSPDIAKEIHHASASRRDPGDPA